MQLMALIDRNGAMSARDAAEILGLSRTQTGRKANDLVTRGWARATQDPDDKRVVLFDLTRAGKRALDNYQGSAAPIHSVTNMEGGNV